MSDEAIAKKWFEASFENSYETISDLSGDCISWGRDGWCSHKIIMMPKDELIPKNAFKKSPCQDIYESFSRFFPKEKGVVKLENITCSVFKDTGASKYIARLSNGNIYFVWETYLIP